MIFKYFYHVFFIIFCKKKDYFSHIFFQFSYFFQTVESELICSTAYVDLFIRQIAEPALLAVFLRYIFTDSCEGKNIIDTLIHRLSLQSQVMTTFRNKNDKR